jgi:hypothetical protein
MWFLSYLLYPIGSMYGIYANIWGVLMVNVTKYSIHGSYGYWDSKHPYKWRDTFVAHLFLLGPAAGGLCQGIRRRALRTGLGKGTECTKLIMSTDE